MKNTELINKNIQAMEKRRKMIQEEITRLKETYHLQEDNEELKTLKKQIVLLDDAIEDSKDALLSDEDIDPIDYEAEIDPEMELIIAVATGLIERNNLH